MVIDWDNFWDLFPFRWGPLRATMKNWRNWVSWSYESAMILVIRDGSYKMVQLQRRGNILNKSVQSNQPLYAFVFYLPFSDVNVQISKAAQRSGWWGCLLRSFGRPNVRMVWKGHLKDVWEMSIDEIQSIDIWWNKILKYGRWKKVLLQRTQDSRFFDFRCAPGLKWFWHQILGGVEPPQVWMIVTPSSLALCSSWPWC